MKSPQRLVETLIGPDKKPHRYVKLEDHERIVSELTKAIKPRNKMLKRRNVETK